MILMTHASPLNENDGERKSRRESNETEFARTARMINCQAKKIGVEADYREDWVNISTNGYETEKNSLEARQQTGIVRTWIVWITQEPVNDWLFRFVIPSKAG